MTTVNCFGISHTGSDSARAILVGSFESIHHVTYTLRHFLISYCTWIFCGFLTTLLKYSFPIRTHSACGWPFALHGVRLLCSRTCCLYWQTAVADGRECSWPAHLGYSPITLPTTVLGKHIAPDTTCVSLYPTLPSFHWSPFARCLACNKPRPKLRRGLTTQNM